MRHAEIGWRAMTAFDFSAVNAIAAEIHPGLFESPEVLAEKQQLYRNGAHVLEIGTRTVGYVLSHPWRRRDPPPLDSRLGALPAEPDTYYIHDLALLPVARRVGAARDIVSTLATHAGAMGFATMSLVAVGNSRAFWERQGFHAVDAPELHGKLRHYGSGAVYMERDLRAPGA
ncbi:MAG TPA: GNAT family N-acetyltransferase [Devosiaceae bacterium]